MAAAETIEVEVVYCPAPGAADCTTLRLRAGSTLAEALAASGLAARHALGADVTYGVWGRGRPLQAVLRDRDRVEVLRPLTVDPKEARRLRYRRQRTGPPVRPAAE